MVPLEWATLNIQVFYKIWLSHVAIFSNFQVLSCSGPEGFSLTGQYHKINRRNVICSPYHTPSTFCSSVNCMANKKDKQACPFDSHTSLSHWNAKRTWTSTDSSFLSSREGTWTLRYEIVIYYILYFLILLSRNLLTSGQFRAEIKRPGSWLCNCFWLVPREGSNQSEKTTEMTLHVVNRELPPKFWIVAAYK